MTNLEVSRQLKVGRQNLLSLYAFSATSRLWFDGGLWVIYFQHRGVSLFDVGLLEAILHIVAVTFDVPIGAFADRFGWKVSLGIGTLMGVVYTITALLANNVWWFALAFAARGLQVTLTNGSDSAISYESAILARMADKYQSISGRMFAIGLVSLGLAEAIGGRLASHSWDWVYIAFTCANILSLVTLLWMKEPRNRDLRGNQQVSVHPSVIQVLSHALRFAQKSPAFVRWIALSGTLSGFIATFAFYGQSLLLHSGWTLAAIGLLMGIENGIGAISTLFSHVITRHLGQRRTMFVIGALSSSGLLLFAWLPGLLAGIGYLVDSVAGNLAEPIVNNGLNKMIPSAQRATLLSANSTAFSLFMMIVFPLFGALAKYVGLAQAAHIASVVGSLCITAATIWWAVPRRRESN